MSLLGISSDTKNLIQNQTFEILNKDLYNIKWESLGTKTFNNNILNDFQLTFTEIISSSQEIPTIPDFIEVPLLPGTQQNVGVTGTTTSFNAFPSISVPSLPYTIPSGVLKGLRLTDTPTLSSDFKASSSGAPSEGDLLLLLPMNGRIQRYHFNANTLSWYSGLREITSIPTIEPSTEVYFDVNVDSSLSVWYKWNDGFWI